MAFDADPIELTEEERRELEQMTQSRMLPAGDVMRARMILMLSDRVPYRRIQDLLQTTAPTISRWKGRFMKHRMAGLNEERHPGQKPTVRTPKLQARILGAIKEGPKDGSTHWSCRKLASRFHVSKDTIQRILAQADVRPHRLERYMASDDPDFETKAADVIGLYLTPPQHAAVFAWMKRPRFRRWTASIRCSRCRPDDSSGTALNTNATVRCRSMQRWM